MISSEEQPQCHIHDKVYDAEDIRENTCVNEVAFTRHTDGNYYCLFHLPTQNKDVGKFEEIFWARLKSVTQKALGIKDLSEEDQEQVRRDLFYDFRYVWFPMEVSVRNYKFLVYASFRSATFFDGAYFRSATFSADANFNAAIFLENVSFRWTKFSAGTYFIESKFADGANFRSAKFLETSQTFFQQTELCGRINFQYASFEGYVSFESEKGESVFVDKNEKNPEVVLDLQNAWLEKPNRISFHRVRLCP